MADDLHIIMLNSDELNRNLSIRKLPFFYEYKL